MRLVNISRNENLFPNLPASLFFHPVPPSNRGRTRAPAHTDFIIRNEPIIFSRNGWQESAKNEGNQIQILALFVPGRGYNRDLPSALQWPLAATPSTRTRSNCARLFGVRTSDVLCVFAKCSTDATHRSRFASATDTHNYRAHRGWEARLARQHRL